MLTVKVNEIIMEKSNPDAIISIHKKKDGQFSINCSDRIKCCTVELNWTELQLLSSEIDSLLLKSI